MILWIILFLLIVAISFVLAYRSMKDYQEIPRHSKTEYGLFLIRRPENFNKDFLDRLSKLLVKEGLIVSFERLFKGSQAALTIYGPKKVLDEFIGELNLLELEDYISNLDHNHLSIWEMGVTENTKPKALNIENIFADLARLGNEEQFFWQVVLSPKQKGQLFASQIRAVVYSKDPQKRQELVPVLQNIASSELLKVPNPFTHEQMMSFFKSRSLAKDSRGPLLEADQVHRLLKV